jgi:hypothetical protein
LFTQEHKDRMRDAIGRQLDTTPVEFRELPGLDRPLTAPPLALAAIGMTYKTLWASEQDRLDVEEARETWLRKMNGWALERLVFIDESGAKTDMTRFGGREYFRGRGRFSSHQVKVSVL